jgi:hypothetical protein
MKSAETEQSDDSFRQWRWSLSLIVLVEDLDHRLQAASNGKSPAASEINENKTIDDDALTLRRRLVLNGNDRCAVHNRRRLSSAISRSHVTVAPLHDCARQCIIIAGASSAVLLDAIINY